MKNQDGLYCQYHKGFIGHSIQGCQNFLDLVQNFMDEERVEFCKKVEGKIISVLQDEAPKLVKIYYR